MSVRRSSWVVPLAGGGCALAVPAQVRDLLRVGVGEVRELVVVGDPALARLFPPAHPDEPGLEAEWQQMMAGQLIEARLAAFDVVDETLDAEELTAAQLDGWLQGVNAVRLVMGTILGVTDDTGTDPHGRAVEESEPDPALTRGRDLRLIEAAYDVLGLLLEHLVAGASEGLDRG